MQKKIREMKIDDYEKAYKLWINTEGMGISDADSKKNIKFFLERNKGLSFVCDYEDEIIGTVLCGHDGRRGYIYHLAVNKQYRNMGIGKELLRNSLFKLKAEGITKCHIFVLNNNEVGIDFWRSSGWIQRDDFTVFSMST